jgi:hypothetical protein
VTNNYAAPSADVIADAESRAAPVVMESGLRAFDQNAGSQLGSAFDLALEMAQVRKDLIQSDAVQEINGGMQRIVALSLGLAFAALSLWGMIGQFFGSDGSEAFEALGRVPLWVLLGHTSWQWMGTMLDAFAALGGMIASSAHGAFGWALREDFWSNAGLGVFSVFVGAFMLLGFFFFALQLFADTAFLGVCAATAPAFLFLKTTPWTSRWGDNWLRMVPATLGDMLALLVLLVLGAAGLDHVTHNNAGLMIAFDLGLLAALPLIRRLFGLEGHSAGSFFSTLFWLRMMRNMRTSGPTRGAPSSAAAGAGAGAAAASATTPTRAPRWSNHYAGPVTAKAALAPSARAALPAPARP